MIDSIPFKVNEVETEELKNTYLVAIEGDLNDADYAYTVYLYDKDEFEEEVSYALAYVIDHLGEECYSEDEVWEVPIKREGSEEYIDDGRYVASICNIPSDEYDYCNMICSIDVYYFDEDGKCYKIDNESIAKNRKYECGKHDDDDDEE